MAISTIRAVIFRRGFEKNWARLARTDDPAAIVRAVLLDPNGKDSTAPGGLPLSWHQRMGRYNSEVFRVVYLLATYDGGVCDAHVSYVAPV